jgi:hypothetical protein
LLKRLQYSRKLVPPKCSRIFEKPLLFSVFEKTLS